jgi:ribose-phosphate pyrophosphokinase
MNDPLIFAGSASRSLGEEIADRSSLWAEARQVLENVRGRQVYLVQGTVFPANDQFMELLSWILHFS